jgi:hypothetical protein
MRPSIQNRSDKISDFVRNIEQPAFGVAAAASILNRRVISL